MSALRQWGEKGHLSYCNNWKTPMRVNSKLFFTGLLAAVIFVSGCKETKTIKESDFFHETTDLKPDTGIEYGRLENGLRYAVMQNATPSNTATLLMRFNTGSINEADDERGLAHFLEHMAFNGSENVPEGELIPRLEKFGLAFGADTNASTGFFETIYQLELPEVNDDIINEALFIMRETASNLLLEPEAIENERGVILAEKRARTSPAFHASIAQLNYFMDGTLIPDRLPIGTEDTIKSVTPEQFRAFYEGYYRPEDTFIVLVGDMETAYASNKISEYFRDWTAKGVDKSIHELKVLGPKPFEATYYSDPEIQTTVSINVMSAPDLRADKKANRKDFYVEALGNRILSRRLAAIAQTEEAPFISAGASTSTTYDAIRISSVSLSSQPENWAQALAAGEQELRKALEFGFTQAELDEQIANSRQSLKVAVERAETRRTSGLARSILGNYSGDVVMTSPEFNRDFFEEYADTITPEQVHAAFKAYWAGIEEPQIYISTSEIIENPEEAIKQAYRDSQSVGVQANEVVETAEFAYRNFGEPGKVKSRVNVEDVDFTQIEFENGVRLNLKKTPYQKGVLSVDMAYGKGELFLEDDGTPTRWLLGNALSLGGLKAHSADELRTIMAGKSVGVGHNMGTRQMFMNGGTTMEFLPEQLNLMMAYYLEPGFRDEAKARYDKWISSFYPTLDSTPGGVASRDLERLIRSDNPRFGIPSEEDLRAASLETASSWLDDSKRGESIEIGVVGDIEIDTVIAEVARTFGTLPKVKAAAPVAPADKIKLKFANATDRPTVLSHAGEDNTALLRVYWPSPDGRDDMVVRRMNLLNSMFKLRLVEVLREELGTSYSPSSFVVSPRTYPEFGYLAASLEVNPEDITKAEARIHTLAEEFKNGEFDEDLFERAITPIRENIEESLESNAYWMNIIARSQTDPEIVARHRRRHDAYQEMKLEDLKPLGKSVFNRDKAVVYHIVPSP